MMEKSSIHKKWDKHRNIKSRNTIQKKSPFCRSKKNINMLLKKKETYAGTIISDGTRNINSHVIVYTNLIKLSNLY